MTSKNFRHFTPLPAFYHGKNFIVVSFELSSGVQILSKPQSIHKAIDMANCYRRLRQTQLIGVVAVIRENRVVFTSEYRKVKRYY